ncbi:MAG: hypothetical protein PVSMB1_12360 [Gemmatimonadaceae bacterium]
MARTVYCAVASPPGAIMRPKLASDIGMIRVAPTATFWQRRRSDGSEEEGARQEAQCGDEFSQTRGR